jgi:hypothetical protein
MSKYDYDCIFNLKRLQQKQLCDALYKICGNTTLLSLTQWRNENKIKSIIDKNRIINKIRNKIILKDIISFEKFIIQELHSIINIVSVYDVMYKFKEIVRMKNIKELDSGLISIDLYYYYCDYLEIKYIFDSKCEEFTFCIDNNILSKNEMLKWNETVYNLNILFKITIDKYDELHKYFSNKLINMILINKFIRSDFNFDDENKTSFETNNIILKLKHINNTPIIDLIKTYINWYTQTFDGFILRKL